MDYPEHPPRADMPFTGIATFARAPFAPEPRTIAADFAVIGIPFDGAIGFRSGPRLAPRRIRDLSTRYALPWGAENPGYWDLETGRQHLVGARLVDLGDADPLYSDLEHLDASVAHLIGATLAAGAVPVSLGGDHSVTLPAIKGLAPAFAPGGPLAGRRLEIVQIDAHLDYMDDVAGFPRSNSSPIRRVTELAFVGGVTCIGLRGLRTNTGAWDAALARGHRLVRMSDIRAGGLGTALDTLPEGSDVYLTLDIDGLDPAVAPGTSSPDADGLSYVEVREIVRAVAAHNRVVALDLVEVNPYLDPGDRTSLLAARLLLESMACIYDGRR